MNIAIASETEEIDGLVPATFKESPFLMIIDADKNQIFHVYGKQDPDNLVFAKKVAGKCKEEWPRIIWKRYR